MPRKIHDSVYVCMYVCMFVCLFVCLYVCMYVCMYVCIEGFNVCMFVCLYVCMYVCIEGFNVCMYVCLYVCMCLNCVSAIWFTTCMRYLRCFLKAKDGTFSSMNASGFIWFTRLATSHDEKGMTPEAPQACMTLLCRTTQGPHLHEDVSTAISISML